MAGCGNARRSSRSTPIRSRDLQGRTLRCGRRLS
jgi:hypothetical protein